MHMNSPGSFHPTSDVMSNLKANFILDLSRAGQIWLSTHVEKDALSTSQSIRVTHFMIFFIHN